MPSPCAIFAGNTGHCLLHSRRSLIQKVKQRGWRVVAVTANDEDAAKLADDGVILEPIQFNRSGIKLHNDIAALLRMVEIYRRHQPCLVHHFRPKAILFGSLAARRVMGNQVKVVNTITGLGRPFAKRGPLQFIAGVGYRSAMMRSDAVIFQNHDDRRIFLDRGWIDERRSRLIIGSGVDTRRYRPDDAIRAPNEPRRILTAGRLLWDKGFGEFAEAAIIVRRQFPNVRFQIVGQFDDVHPNAIQPRELDTLCSSAGLEYLGFLSSLDQILREIDIFVIPSYYREGVPRVLLEAAASGVPAVGADMPGIRESISHGETGFLAPPRDEQALAERILQLLENEDLRSRMGRSARRKMVEQFELADIVEKQLDVYREIGVSLDSEV